MNILNLDRTVGVCLLPYAIVKYGIETETPIKMESGKPCLTRKREFPIIFCATASNSKVLNAGAWSQKRKGGFSNPHNLY
ncbi:MAG: hypothetical protein GY866_12485 [Proteobacteria bacterium]|nr:hypothetical protein [Pseudomonadota bacterium]